MIEEVLAEREAQYGTYAGQAEIAQGLKDYIRGQLEDRNRVLLADQSEALDMIFSKIARIVNGNPDHIDSWMDIAGYAKLVANRLEKEATE